MHPPDSIYGSGFHTQYVNHMPYEVVKKRRGSRCRDDWYASRSQVACGFHEEDGHKIFDSQVCKYAICEWLNSSHIDLLCPNIEVMQLHHLNM